MLKFNSFFTSVLIALDDKMQLKNSMLTKAEFMPFSDDMVLSEVFESGEKVSVRIFNRDDEDAAEYSLSYTRQRADGGRCRLSLLGLTDRSDSYVEWLAVLMNEFNDFVIRHDYAEFNKSFVSLDDLAKFLNEHNEDVYYFPL